MTDLAQIRKEFPILEKKIHGKTLCYLDNGASAQKPKKVLESINTAYASEYANVHRGLHYLSNLATDNYEAVRNKIKEFLGAEFDDEIIFTSGTTEALNLVSYGWGTKNLEKGDEIILSVLEHHANIVPWHFLRERLGVVLKWVEPRSDGSIEPADIYEKITKNTKLIALTQMSNVLGSILDLKTICNSSETHNIPVLVDGSQAAAHMKIDVMDIGCDFYCVTGHKLYGPSGSGAIYIRRPRLDEMVPFMGGGSMINEVGRDKITYNIAPHKFEAGTPGIVEMIGLGAALDFIEEIGFENITRHEKRLTEYTLDRFESLDWLQVHGSTRNRGAIFSFNIQGQAHPHDISTILDRKGIAVRAGHHCAQPLMDFLGITASCRASFALYNTEDEVDLLVNALKDCHRLFN